MKTALLLRHAKSSWDDPSLGDFDRPLAPRGRKAPPRIARFMRAEGLIPGAVFCSAARRAFETWALVASGLDAEIPVETRHDLYHGAPDDLLEVLRGAPDAAASALLVGHSPGIEALAFKLAGPGSDEQAVERLCEKFPTAGLAVIAFDGDAWRDIGARRGALTHLVRPRDLV